MAEPPCNCDTPQYHEPDCAYKAWVDAGRPTAKEAEEKRSNIPPGLLYGLYRIPIDQIKQGKNTRPPGSYTLEKLKRDIAKNGLVNPIVVCPLDDGTYETKDGNLRLQACKDLKLDEIDCFIVPK